LLKQMGPPVESAGRSMAEPDLLSSLVPDAWYLPTSSSIALAFALAFFAHCLTKQWSKQVSDTSQVEVSEQRGDGCVTEGQVHRSEHHGLWKGPNLQGTFVPSQGMVIANPDYPYQSENERCTFKFLPMHRPTWNAQLDKSGHYPFSQHFQGRKRLWEMRLQFVFKSDINEVLRFGIELDEYVPLNAATKRLMHVAVSALRRVVGDDLYHSPGDDPKRSQGPHEKPVFTMPLWAFDQFMVTPEGEEPPDLMDPSFHEFGWKRTDDRSEFIREISALKLKAGPTYTFAFWGISQFMDQINWKMTKVIPFKSIDFNLFCGAPPVHLVLYTLSENEEGETRHLQSRKSYLFQLAFWSSKCAPNPARVNHLFAQSGDSVAALAAVSPKRNSRHHRLLACCSGQR